MCCCDCLFVAALERQLADEARARQAPADARAATPVAASIDRVPERLCGWVMLPFLHRRWRGLSGKVSAS